MPHQCTSCGRVFPDGSKEMLSGCPDCGGNKFQFHPGTPRSDSRTEEPSEADSPASEGETPANADSAAHPATPSEDADSTRGHGEWPDHSSTRPSSDSETPASEPSPPASTADAAADADTDAEDAEVAVDDEADRPADVEDRAQASARSDIVAPDELEHAAEEHARRRPPADDGRVIEPSSDDRPGLDELREELNSQFESIKIVNPGQYELNLMELYDRQEYIISLQEDGRYVIEMPDTWGGADADDE